MLKKVVVAMSGGVDSTVAALLLKRKGFDVAGLFMRNWDEREEKGGGCRADEDQRDMERACQHIRIPCQSVNFVKEYWNEVFSNCLAMYQRGYTPNPDILCNQKIKFDLLWKYISRHFGDDVHMATGHYARVERNPEVGGGAMRLLQAADRFKDQTYFLSLISQAALQKTIFPIGSFMKEEVKEIAREAGLDSIASKKESMGLCFIGKRKDFSKFLSEYIEDVPGHFVTLDGKVVGQHRGHHLFTIGQRTRISGVGHEAWFIARKDVEHNRLTVVEGSSHPALFSSTFSTLSPHWVTSYPPPLPHTCRVKCRHQQRPVECVVSRKENGCLSVELAGGQSLRAVTPGQYAVFYSREEGECYGGACIAGDCANSSNDNSKSQSLGNNTATRECDRQDIDHN